MNPVVLIVVGLPGCGKTKYLEELRRDGWSTFDDFKAKAVDDRFQSARGIEDLLLRLRSNCKCAVADIDFCKGDARDEAEEVLRAAVPSVDVRWCFFANDAQACELNIKQRNRESIDKDLEQLRRYFPLYSIPNGAHLRSVPALTFESQPTSAADSSFSK